MMDSTRSTSWSATPRGGGDAWVWRRRLWPLLVIAVIAVAAHAAGVLVVTLEVAGRALLGLLGALVVAYLAGVCGGLAVIGYRQVVADIDKHGRRQRGA